MLCLTPLECLLVCNSIGFRRCVLQCRCEFSLIRCRIFKICVRYSAACGGKLNARHVDISHLTHKYFVTVLRFTGGFYIFQIFCRYWNKLEIIDGKTQTYIVIVSACSGAVYTCHYARKSASCSILFIFQSRKPALIFRLVVAVSQEFIHADVVIVRAVSEFLPH